MTVQPTSGDRGTGQCWFFLASRRVPHRGFFPLFSSLHSRRLAAYCQALLCGVSDQRYCAVLGSALTPRCAPLFSLCERQLLSCVSQHTWAQYNLPSPPLSSSLPFTDPTPFKRHQASPPQARSSSSTTLSTSEWTALAQDQAGGSSA